LAAGVVDFGLALHRTETLADAVRQGARLGAALTREAEGASYVCPGLARRDPSCNNPFTLDCRDPLNEYTIECLSRKETALYLEQARFNPADWDINAETCLAENEGGFEARVIKVSIQRAAGNKGCIFCLFGINFERASSSFSLEGGC